MAKETVQTAQNTEDAMKASILAGIVDKDARTYTMNKTVSVGGKEREGVFRFHYPTVADRLRHGIMQSKYLNGVPVGSVDIVTYNIAFATAYLGSCCDQKPVWFRFEDMDYIEELEEMFMEVTAFVDSFRKDAETAADAADSQAADGAATVANS